MRCIGIIHFSSLHLLKKDGQTGEKTEESNKYYLWGSKYISADDTYSSPHLADQKRY